MPAFNRKNLGLADSGQNSDLPRNWAYTTPDTIAEINTEGYFNGASDLLSVGDRITAITSNGGTASYDTFFVSENAAGVVDVNDGSANDGASDTD